MSLPVFIKDYKKKIITLDEIEKHVSFSSQKELKQIIDGYIQEGFIVPFGKDTTYKFPNIHLKFKIVKKENFELKNEINSLKLLDTSYYLKHFDEFEKDKRYLFQIQDYFSKSMPEDISLSFNERSLEIFKDEKFLLSSRCKQILNRIGLSIENFNVYSTPEIFMYYRHVTKTGNVLIVENKDTWVTFKKALIDGYDILGMYFDAIIFGEGKKILSSFSFIYDKEFESFNSLDNTFYYFGDLDSTGISILYSLIHKYKTTKIIPFIKGYDVLIHFMNQYGHIKYVEDNKEKRDNNITLDEIKFCFPNYDIDIIYNFCRQNKIVPQEVVNNRRIRGDEKYV